MNGDLQHTMNATIFDYIPSCLDQADTPWDDAVASFALYVIYRDKFPVSPGHLLFVPRYNSVDVLSEVFYEAMRYGQRRVHVGEWDAFNIGMNYGSEAGQTIMWPHIHLIPRFGGDVSNPRGGVRNLLQNGLGDYCSSAVNQV